MTTHTLTGTPTAFGYMATGPTRSISSTSAPTALANPGGYWPWAVPTKPATAGHGYVHGHSPATVATIRERATTPATTTNGCTTSAPAAGIPSGWPGRSTRNRDGTVIATVDTADVPDGAIYTPCGNRRASVCPACAEVYRRDAYHLIKAGLTGDRWSIPRLHDHIALFVTATAPSFAPVHHRLVDVHAADCRTKDRCTCRPKRCHPFGRPCRHGVPAACRTRHKTTDPALGQPLCLDCYDHPAHVIWNHEAPELWRRTIQNVRRNIERLGRNLGWSCAAATSRSTNSRSAGSSTTTPSSAWTACTPTAPKRSSRHPGRSPGPCSKQQSGPRSPAPATPPRHIRPTAAGAGGSAGARGAWTFSTSTPPAARSTWRNSPATWPSTSPKPPKSPASRCAAPTSSSSTTPTPTPTSAGCYAPAGTSATTPTGGGYADLVAAARRGEAFATQSGLPVSMQRITNTLSWYRFACQFIDLEWSKVAATTRRTNAEAITAITVLMITEGARGRPDDQTIRVALQRWAFNTRTRDTAPTEARRVLAWLDKHTRPVAALSDPVFLRLVLTGLSARLDGKPYAPSVISRRRKILNAAVEYATERQLLSSNPMPALKWKPPKPSLVIDPRTVPNPMQARTLLQAVGTQSRSGPRLVVFFGCLYYAAMRPEEAVGLTKANLALPREGWGKIHLEIAEPYAGKDWTDSGHNRDRRRLKQREKGEIRTVPCPPELTALIREHVKTFGFASDGRLFVGERNARELPKLTITRAWKRARADTFTPEVATSALAGTPYDLRHAAVSTWLHAGVPPAKVAEWAGQSVETLFRIYAKFLDGGEDELYRRIDAAYGNQPPSTPCKLRHAFGTITQ